MLQRNHTLVGARSKSEGAGSKEDCIGRAGMISSLRYPTGDPATLSSVHQQTRRSRRQGSLASVTKTTSGGGESSSLVLRVRDSNPNSLIPAVVEFSNKPSQVSNGLILRF